MLLSFANLQPYPGKDLVTTWLALEATDSPGGLQDLQVTVDQMEDYLVLYSTQLFEFLETRGLN